MAMNSDNNNGNITNINWKRLRLALFINLCILATAKLLQLNDII